MDFATPTVRSSAFEEPRVISLQRRLGPSVRLVFSSSNFYPPSNNHESGQCHKEVDRRKVDFQTLLSASTFRCPNPHTQISSYPTPPHPPPPPLPPHPTPPSIPHFPSRASGNEMRNYSDLFGTEMGRRPNDKVPRQAPPGIGGMGPGGLGAWRVLARSCFFC